MNSEYETHSPVFDWIADINLHQKTGFYPNEKQLKVWLKFLVQISYMLTCDGVKHDALKILYKFVLLLFGHVWQHGTCPIIKVHLQVF